MKKSKRTWLLLAGVAALSATLLVPTVLSACSTTPNTENPGDDNNSGDQNQPEQPSVPNLLDEELSKLNESNNNDVRTNLYTKYVKSLSLKSIVNNEGFFDELINMIKVGLTVGDSTGSGKISESDLNKLIDALSADKVLMKTESTIQNNELTTGSYWSSFAFEFKDTEDATWIFTNKDKSVQYELFLTSNVDIKYESTSDDIKVKIKNNVTDNSKVKSRLVVRTKTATEGQGQSIKNQEPVTTISEFNFKSNYEFGLPSGIFNNLTSFFNSYSDGLKTLKTTLEKGSKKYEEIVKKGVLQAATLWNQFSVLNFNQMQQEMASDLNVNRQDSKVAKWIINNFKSTTTKNTKSTIDTFKSDLSQADWVQLDLYPLTINGASQSAKNLNDASDEEPNFTLSISLRSSSNDQLDGKWYVLDLYATGLQITPKLSDDPMFGYINSSFTTTPKLTLGSNSSFGSYTVVSASEPSGKQTVGGGYEIGDVKPVDDAVGLSNVGVAIDVSDLYDFGTSGFTEYLSNLITNNSGSHAKNFNALLEVNDGSVDVIAKLKEYISENQEVVKGELLKPDNLADLILDNIDVSNIAMHSQKFGTINTSPTDTIPSKDVKNSSSNKKGWRENINAWVAGEGGKQKPNVTFKSTVINLKNADTINQSVSEKFKNAADITIRGEDARNTGHAGVYLPENPLDFGTNDFKFRSIYIFLGNGTTENKNIETTIVNGFNSENSSFATLDADLKNTTASNNGNDQTWDSILEAVQNKFCIVLEKAKTIQDQGTNTPPVYALYMGQEKQTGGTLRNTSDQSKFPISLDALLGDGKAFLDKLTKK